MTANIPVPEACQQLYGGERHHVHEDLPDLYKLDEAEPVEQIPAIEWPLPGVFSIDSAGFPDGATYIQSRGLAADVAKQYGIMYGPPSSILHPSYLHRRVFIPIMRNGVCLGFQARAIDRVSDKDRMRNNEGFHRDRLIMFEDRMRTADHVIICEGPFDAIKFHKAGGNICTMGKVVTAKQLEIIKSYKPQKVYLALDADADVEIMQLAKAFSVPVYYVQVPESVQQRCKALGKKADFGECTMDECLEAVKAAVLADDTFFVLDL
jgi:5S rRNA maturation endonuclease (ribonuclease M5)